MRNILSKIAALLWGARFFALSIAAACVIFYCGLFLVFRGSGDKIKDFLSKSLGCEVQVESSKFLPSLVIEMRNIKIWAPGESSSKGDAPSFSVERAVLRPSFAKLLTGKVKLRRVRLINPAFEVHAARSGGLNTDAWIKHAYSCTLRDSLPSIPARVDIEGGSAVYKPGKSGARDIRVDGISGTMGLARDGHVAVRAAGSFMGSPVELAGGMLPCSFENLSFKINSDSFDFSGAWKEAAALAGSPDASSRISLGTGSLEILIGGAADSPTVTGQVSLKDVSASFSVSAPYLSLREIRAGIGDTGITGSGEIDFSTPDLRYNMEFNARGIDFARLLTPATGAKFAPDGVLRGSWRMTGNLAGTDKPAIRGDITVENGSLRIPVPQLGPEHAKTPDTLRLPFNLMSLHAEFDDGSVSFRNLSVSGKGYNITGDANIEDAGGVLTGFRQGFAYNLDLSVTSEKIEDMLGSAPGFDGLLTGKLNGKIRVRGDLRRAGSAQGSVILRASDGVLANPYAPSNYPGEVPFQQLDANVSIASLALKLKGSLLDAGVDVDWGGFITPDGTISLTGQALIDLDKAAGVATIARNLATGAISRISRFKAGLRVTGTLQNPISEWSPPSITTLKPETRSTVTFDELQQPVPNETTITVDTNSPQDNGQPSPQAPPETAPPQIPPQTPLP